MVSPNEVYARYYTLGGLEGIAREIATIFEEDWKKHPEVLEWYKRCVDIYKKIFPKGHPPKDPEEAIRRVSIIAAYLGRLRRHNPQKAKEIESLYQEYRNLTRKMIYYRNAWRDARVYRHYFWHIADIVRAAKTTVNIKNKLNLYYEAIQSFFDRGNFLVNFLREKHPNAYELYRKILDLVNLGTTWFRFKYVITFNTEDERLLVREVELHVETWTHAELLFLEYLDDVLFVVSWIITKLTDNDWIWNLEELKGGFKYLSKQLLEFKQNIIPKKVDFYLKLYDHNYGITRIEAKGKWDWDWLRKDVKELIKALEIYKREVRGRKGRLPKGWKLVFEEVTIDGRKIKVVKLYQAEGKELPVDTISKAEKVKIVVTDEIVKLAWKKLKELKSSS